MENRKYQQDLFERKKFSEIFEFLKKHCPCLSSHLNYVRQHPEWYRNEIKYWNLLRIIFWSLILYFYELYEKYIMKHTASYWRNLCDIRTIKFLVYVSLCGYEMKEKSGAEIDKEALKRTEGKNFKQIQKECQDLYLIKRNFN